MSRLTVNAIALNVEESRHGSPLLLLHGFTGSNATWQVHLPALTTAHRVIMVEMLGHGQSDAPADPLRYTIEQTASDLTAILDALKIEQTAVLGYSMGGRVALHFALTRPDRVNHLILESASPGLATSAERAARIESDNALADFTERAGIAAFVERWEKLPLWDSQKQLPATVREGVRRQRLANNPVGLANSLRGLGTGRQPSLWDRLGNLQIPTLLLAGALDAKFCQIARQMHELIPVSCLEIIPQAGHAAHLENPAEFDRLVTTFLAENPQ